MGLRHVAIVTVALSLVSSAALADSPITRKEATVIAHAIRLTPDDMADYDAMPHVVPRGERRIELDLDRCIGIFSPRPVVELSSDDFYLEDTGDGVGPAGGTVTSGVVVMPTTASAVRRQRAVGTKRAQMCSDKYSDVPKDRTVSTKTTNLPAPVHGVLGQRYVARVHFGKKVEEFTAYVYSYRRGPVIASVAFVSGDTPFAPAERRRLIELLVARVNQNAP